MLVRWLWRQFGVWRVWMDRLLVLFGGCCVWVDWWRVRWLVMLFVGMYRISGYLAHFSISGIRCVIQLSGIRPDIMLVSGRIPDNCTFSCNKQLYKLFLGRIMMMLPLIINSYNLVNFHWNFMKLVLNKRISHCLSFPGNIFLLSSFFLNLILMCLWTRKISALNGPWYLPKEWTWKS